MRPTAVLFIAVTLVGASSCGRAGNDVSGSDVATSDPSDGVRSYLQPTERLLRISMALRGTRPSLDELAAVRADPGALDGLVDAYLDTPEFAATVKDLHAEIFLLRRDTFEMLPALGALFGYNQQDIYRSQVEEPLRLVEHIVMNDRPYTEIVTADYAFANDVLAKMYGMPYDSQSSEEWQLSWWSDGRPAAGLLSSAEMMRRWESNGSNFNRGRANMVAGKLLCSEFDTRDITVQGGIDVADELAVSHAVMTEETCSACHQTLDPLAGYFWGFMRVVRRDVVRDAIESNCAEWDYSDGAEPPYGPNHAPEYYCYPITQYATFAENDWEDWELRAPAYFGQPAHDLTEVGEHIAADPRFSACMARRFYGYIAQLPQKAVPFDVAAELQQVFEDSGFNAKALMRAVVLHDSFAAYATTEEQSLIEPVVGLKTVRPEQYARFIYELTGYRWITRADKPGCGSGFLNGSQCWGDVELTTSDLFGFRAMQGGVDSFIITKPQFVPTPTKLLTMDMLAHDAARYAIDHDFDAAPSAESRRLLQQVDEDTTDEAAVRQQLVWLHERILGVQAPNDDADIGLSYSLFADVQQDGGSVRDAWTVTIATLLQDPRVIFF